MEYPFGFGADSSKNDYRTIQHTADMAFPVTMGGYTYKPEDIEHQHKVGICTAISLTQNAQKALGRKYSADFQYLLQKKLIDQNWTEGSSILSALKVANKYGFLPIDDFVYIKEEDRNLSYSEYILKLQAIPDVEVQRLVGLCENKIAGYAQVDVSAPENISKAILGSKAGILCRYQVDQAWWTAKDGRVTWSAKEIDPIRPCTNMTFGGHAITGGSFDYTDKWLLALPNTWGSTWCNLGTGHTDLQEYRPTEAWIPYYDNAPEVIVNRPKLPDHQPITRKLVPGMTGDDVKRIQHVLGVTPETGFFGVKTTAAVLAFQKKYGISPAPVVGPLTRAKLNELYFS